MLDWTAKRFAENLVRYSSVGSDALWSAAIDPPPSRAICMHVRHGDKWKEMRYDVLITLLAVHS